MRALLYWLVVWLPFFIFPYIGNNHPNWLICFRGVQTTNQYSYPHTIQYSHCSSCFLCGRGTRVPGSPLIARPCGRSFASWRSWLFKTPVGWWLVGDYTTQSIGDCNNPITNQYNGIRKGFWTLLIWWSSSIYLYKFYHMEVSWSGGTQNGWFSSWKIPI